MCRLIISSGLIHIIFILILCKQILRIAFCFLWQLNLAFKFILELLDNLPRFIPPSVPSTFFFKKAAVSFEGLHLSNTEAQFTCKSLLIIWFWTYFTILLLYHAVLFCNFNFQLTRSSSNENNDFFMPYQMVI